MRVPRSGSMVLSMLVALVAIFLLPIVFLGALSHSADAHPQSVRQTLHDLAEPVRSACGRVAAFAQRLR